MFPNTCKILPKWRNFAKSGHTGRVMFAVHQTLDETRAVFLTKAGYFYRNLILRFYSKAHLGMNR